MSDLTPREYEVWRLVAQGLTNKQIAGELSVEARTVEGHANRIYRALGIEDGHKRVKAARIYYKRWGMM